MLTLKSADDDCDVKDDGYGDIDIKNVPITTMDNILYVYMYVYI